MGLYDELNFSCPRCNTVNTFQSKANYNPCLRVYRLNTASLAVLQDFMEDCNDGKVYCESCNLRIAAELVNKPRVELSEYVAEEFEGYD